MVLKMELCHWCMTHDGREGLVDNDDDEDNGGV